MDFVAKFSAKGLAKGFGWFAAAVVLTTLLAAPSYAADDTSCSDNGLCLKLNGSKEVQLKRDNAVPNSTTYSSTVLMSVTTDHNKRAVLTMQTSNPNLVNESNTALSIPSMKKATDTVPSGSWGVMTSYSTDGKTSKGADDKKMHPLPAAGKEVPIFDLDLTKDFAKDGKANISVFVAFMANINANDFATGTYSTKVTYTLTSGVVNKSGDSSVCRSGDLNSNCQVDLDPNMVPIRYTGSDSDAQWKSVSYSNTKNTKGQWYDYGKKQWANAVTVKRDVIEHYRDKDDVPINPNDVLGYWVYIPRYAYEVMRKEPNNSAIDTPENFQIRFEKATDKHIPGKCATDKDGVPYRGGCSLDRNYIPGKNQTNSTWATHPAFTFGDKELNGIWVAKFELTGTSKQPTVLPNERVMTIDRVVRTMGDAYRTATTIGQTDKNNVGGSNVDPMPPQNSHSLVKLSSRMARNSDWGAIVYFANSAYGAGFDKIQPNNFAANSLKEEKLGYMDVDSPNQKHYGKLISGCGPAESGSNEIYSDVGTLDTQTACSTSNSQRAYNGKLGQLASTTGNVYGVYDMLGGGEERVAASYSTDGTSSVTNKFMTAAAHKPYIDLYKSAKPNVYGFAGCTWETCGGQAMYEVDTLPTASEGADVMWGGGGAKLIDQASPYAVRGSSSLNTDEKMSGKKSIFYELSVDGSECAKKSVRVVLN